MFHTYCKQIADYDKMLPFKLAGVVFTGKIRVTGLAKGDNLEHIVKSFCASKKIYDIADIQMPIAIPAVDLKTGEIVYYLNKKMDENCISRRPYDDTPSYVYNGNIGAIVRASSSFPGVFEPKRLDSRLLIDGGVRVNSPVSVLKRMGADKVLTVSFDQNKCKKQNLNIVSVAMKSFEIMGHQVNMEELENADIVLSPPIDEVSLLECGKTNYLATQGYKCTKANIDKIRSVL